MLPSLVSAQGRESRPVPGVPQPVLVKAKGNRVIIYTDKHRVPFQIDDDDYEVVKRYFWFIRDGYPSTAAGKGDQARCRRIHEFLLGRAPDGLEWDHIDRDRLNNKRSNLRAVTHSFNLHNRGAQRNNRTGHPGVVYRDQFKTYRAQIKVMGKMIHIGSFKTLESAVKARTEAKAELVGQ